MDWSIEFTDRARQQLRKLGRAAAWRIARFLTARLAALYDPGSIGVLLRHGFIPCFWRDCVGNYRIVVRVEDGILRVLVIRIAHRREA